MILPFALAFSAFGIAFWMPGQRRSTRMVFASLLVFSVGLGALAAFSPAVAQSAWLPWAWALIGLANVLGWGIVVLTSAKQGDVSQQE